LTAADFVEQNIVALLIGIGVICLLVALAMFLRANLSDRKKFNADEA